MWALCACQRSWIRAWRSESSELQRERRGKRPNLHDRSTCTSTPFTGDRNLSPMPRQCQGQHRAQWGHWSLCALCDFLAVWCREIVHSPKSSDSNRHVSPTPTLRHQARKLAVLSLAKKEPEGALCRHGILRLGIFCAETERLTDVFMCARMKNIPQMHRWTATVNWTWFFLLCLTKRKQMLSRLICAAQPPEFPSKHRATHSVSTLISSPSVKALVSAQNQGTFSIQINMGDGGSEIRGYFTRPAMIRDQMTCLWVSAPTRSVQGDLCALLWFYTGYVRLCYEKGAVSSCWKYAGFCGYFSFLSRLSFWLFWDPFFCWITLHSWGNNVHHTLRLTIRTAC